MTSPEEEALDNAKGKKEETSKPSWGLGYSADEMNNRKGAVQNKRANERGTPGKPTNNFASRAPNQQNHGKTQF
ncbi:hypothetical protein IAQ61_003001 [Plenodomus lingam]|uniref:uncharacterized protein n=1 Tax=Leptosphaeria maculans TaxID=5022 RepID=UPI0033300D60|nr:hypothetical protein IAQ61_003001 [Plenodomus lingam]